MCMQVKRQQLEPDMEQIGTKSGKEYVKAVYCHHAYLTYMQSQFGSMQSLSCVWLFASMQSTSCEMPGWMKHKLESSLLEEMSVTSDMQMTPPLWQKVKK